MLNEDYDDTPYRDTREVTPTFTVGLVYEESDAYWVFVDEADTRLARQRFDDDDDEDGYLTWLADVVVGIREDPEGRDKCGDCGNRRNSPRGHAPDCAYANLTS